MESEMVGAMLLGAWLLIQQLQCCVQGKGPLLVDPLTRRSPLDKNFMRFGRSEQLRLGGPVSKPPLPLDDKGFEVKKVVNTNFMRFGRDNGRWEGRVWGGLRRQVRGAERTVRNPKGRQDNFIRLGREAGCGLARLGRSPTENFIRFGRGEKEAHRSSGVCRGALLLDGLAHCCLPSSKPRLASLPHLLLNPHFSLLPSPHNDLKDKRSAYNKNFIRLG